MGDMKIIDMTELQTKIQETTSAIHIFRSEVYENATDEPALIKDLKGLIYEATILLPSGTPCHRCNGSGIEPTP